MRWIPLSLKGSSICSKRPRSYELVNKAVCITDSSHFDKIFTSFFILSLLLPDSASSLEFRGVEIIPSGPVEPDAKRDIGAKQGGSSYTPSSFLDRKPRSSNK